MTGQDKDPLGFPKYRDGETVLQRQLREADALRAAELVMARIFSGLRHHLGANGGSRAFRKIANKLSAVPVKKDGKRVRADSARNAYLLDQYDLVKERFQGEPSIRALAKDLAQNARNRPTIGGKPVLLGNSAEAIERHIRRLLGERHKRDAASADVARMIKELTKSQGTTS